MSAVTGFYALPVEALLHLPGWLVSVVVGLQITAKIALGGWILARSGRSPLWILLLLVPYGELLALWVFAYVDWPAERLVREAAARTAAETAPASADAPPG